MARLKVGITGGIGSGKSFVCGLIRGHGYKVFDCDSEAKKLMMTDDVVVESITRLVGNDAYIIDEHPDGHTSLKLNRGLIADFLFAGKENAQLVNSAVHPRLALKFKNWAENQPDHVVFMESAILFESGFDRLVDFTVLVDADDELRIARAMRRDHVDRKSVQSRMALQIPHGQLRTMTDYHILNNGTDNLKFQLEQMLREINIHYNFITKKQDLC